MLISLTTKKPLSLNSLTPLDFYRFRHRQETVKSFGMKLPASRPLWIVGVSPFDPVISNDEGHVVHLGTPRFTARWTMCDESIAQLATPDYYDEELNIAIYETILMEPAPERMEEWLLEAVCAVAYSKGMIAMADPEEAH